MDNTGDFNAIIGTKTTKEDFKSMGKLGIWKRNKRGDRLIEFAEEHKLMIANTLFYFRNQNKKQKKTDTGLGSHQMGKQETR